MNKKLERAVILVGTLKITEVDPSIRMAYFRELKPLYFELMADLKKDPKQFTAAELIIMDWVQTVMKAFLTVQNASDAFDSDEAAGAA
jgi:hypothetical protein